VLEKIEKVIRRWEREHGWEFWPQFFGVTRDAARAEIMDAWNQVRRLPGRDALENAVEFARQTPLRIYHEIFDKRD
jgi:hypothetical protein